MRQREVTAESLHELLLRSSQSVSSTSQPIISGQGLDKNLKQARAFYTLILLSTGVGVGLDFVGVNPVKALYWTAIINGLLAPFLLVAILVVASDKKLMQGQPSSRLGWTVVALTTVAMFAAGVAMFVV
jgi:Mn2+/Fe2+ NRAMP family transporter